MKNWVMMDSEFGGRPCIAVFCCTVVRFPRGPSCLLVFAAVSRGVGIVVHAKRPRVASF